MAREQPVDILIIGDAHAKPGVPNDRFEWAGRFAAERCPDVIVDMGDWEDMPSLSAYDVGKKSYEGRTYKADLEAAWEARELFNKGLNSFDGEYEPLKVALGGNHAEGRLARVLEEDRKLEGTLSVDDFRHKDYGWLYVPYRQPCDIAGFTFCHYFVSGVMGRPIGGEMPSLQLIRKQLTSCIAGHSHLFDIAHRTKPDGSRVWGIVAGCFLDRDQWEDYANAANLLWWRGLVLLKGCQGGDFESIETVTVEQLEDMYGAQTKRSRKRRNQRH